MTDDGSRRHNVVLQLAWVSIVVCKPYPGMHELSLWDTDGLHGLHNHYSYAAR